MLVNITTWPGRFALKHLPELGEAEARLVHNMINYVVWLSLFIAVLLYFVVRFSPV